MSSKSRSRSAPAPAPVSRISVGSPLDASCTKCKTVTGHVVAAKIGEVPTRVQCNTCNSVHVYKAPRRPSVAAPERASEGRTLEAVWKDAMRRARGPAVPYSTKGSYEVGARMSHLSFGEGVVARRTSTTVCEVIFEGGAVKLLMGSAL